MRRLFTTGIVALVVAATTGTSEAVARLDSATQTTCPPGYVEAVIGGEPKCLHEGEYCASKDEPDYNSHGFTCWLDRLAPVNMTGPIHVMSASGAMKVKPRAIPLGVSSVIRKIQWQSYGGATAVGRGERLKYTCRPNCAAGRAYWVKVKLQVLRVGICQHVRAYRSIRVDGRTTPISANC